MGRSRLWRGGLIAMLSVALGVTLLFGVLSAGFFSANAAQVTVTVQSDGNGSVSCNDKTSDSVKDSKIEVQAESGASITLNAQAAENYVFAYWYTAENTPLSYDSTYEYTVPAETTTVHAKFFKKGDEITVTTSDGWNKEVEGTYKIKSETEYNFQPKQDIPIYFEFVGEKWFNFDYNLSVTTGGGYYGYIYVFVDGLQYIGQSFTSDMISKNTSNCLRTLGNKYHRVEIRYQTPNDRRAEGTSSEVPTALEFTLNNILLKDESEYGTTQTSVAWDARLGEAYILPGVVKASGDTNDEFIIAHGTKLQNKDGSATVSVLVGVPIAFAIKPFEQVDSTIVPEQKTGVHYGGVKYGGTLAFGKAISFKFNAEGKVSATENNSYSETNISFDLKEIAFAPKVSITKVIDSVYQQEETISDNGRVELPYGKTNNLLVTIEHYEKVTNTFSVTAQGQEVSCENLMGKTGFSLNDITENKTVVITYKYEDKYHVEGPFTFNVYIKLEGGNDGLDSILSPISNEVTITNDKQYPWYFDPAGNGEGSFAFSSGISYQPDGTLTVPAFSQLGFTVKGNGSFTFEFHIDGYALAAAATDDTAAKYSYAAYSIDSPIPTNTPYKSGWLANNPSWTEAPWGVKGFKPEIATNLGWGLSTAADKPIAPKTFNAETVDAKNFWYKVTISIKGKGDDEETSIYIAHAIGNKSNSSFACMSVRNVAFFSGKAYADWGVEGADGIVQNNGEITVDVGKAGLFDAGKAINFTAKPTAEQTFYGWKIVSGTLTNADKIGHESDPGFTVEDSDITWDTANARLVSYEPDYRYVVAPGYNKVVAVIADKGTYAVRHGNSLYKPGDVASAFTAAEQNEDDKNVVVVDNVTLDGITVPAGVNLIIPFNRTGDYYAMGTATTAQTRVSWASGGIYKDPVYTLTLTGENTVNGTLMVGGVLHYPDQSAQGHTSGYYSQLILSGEKTKLTVGKGGHLDVYGRVTGDGAIDVTSGGKLSQPFMITDYNGGTNTQDSFNAGVTPFKMYAMVNVQNKGGFTIHHGAELWGHASLYFFSSITTLDAPFISYVKEHRGGMDYFQNDALIVLNDDASAHIVYDDNIYEDVSVPGQHKRVAGIDNVEDVGFTKIEITGNAYADFMQFPLGINTTQVYFSIPYNYEITLKSGGNLDILHPYKMMPGSSFTVEENATLTVRTPTNGLPNGLHVYDAFSIPNVAKRTYPTGDQLKAAGYLPYASLIVNGTLNIQDGATFLGTVQTTSSEGKIIVGSNVKLKDDTLFDGVSTKYSCNYTKYTLEAHIWDAVHQTLAPMEAGKTYDSVYTGKETFALPAMTFQIETTKGDHRGSDHTLTNSTTSVATGLKGAWKVEHDDHTFVWKDGVDFEGAKFKKEHGFCTELGCDEPVVVLNMQDFALSATYKGTAFEETDIDALLTTYFFGSSEAKPDWFSWNLALPDEPITNVNSYNFTLTLTRGFFSDSAETSKQLTFTVEKFDLGNLNKADKVEAEAQLTGRTYNGEEQSGNLTVKGTNSGFEGDATFTADWSNAINAGDASVTLTGTGNFTGSVTLNFIIEKKTINLNLIKQTAPYSGLQPEIDSTKYTTDDILAQDKAGVQITLKFVKSEGPWNVGLYDLTAELAADVEANKNYMIGTVGSSQNVFEITAKSISGATVELTNTTFVYSGAAQTPFSKLTLDGFTFTANDYDVAYASNINAGQATVTVTGKGNFKDSATATFTITKKSIAEGVIGLKAGPFTYNGEEQKPFESFTLAGFEMKSTDYTVSYSGNTAAGQATVTVSAAENGNFEGSVKSTFDIAKATLTITPDAKYSPKGQAIVPLTATVTGLIEKDKATFAAAESTIYELVCTGLTNTEEKTFPITVKILSETWENYTVKAYEGEILYTVTSDVFTGVSVASAQDATYDGTEHTVAVTLPTVEDATFSYEVSVADGAKLLDAGTYAVTVTVTYKGSAEYTQTYKVTYTIAPMNIAADGVTVTIVLAKTVCTYSGMLTTPLVTSVKANGLDVTEFTASYSNNVNVTDAAVATITASGNFTGSASTTFEIAPLSLESAVAVLNEEEFVYNGAQKTPTATVNIRIGELNPTLSPETDYTLEYSNNVNAGQAVVTVKGKGNFTGSPAALTFTIAPKPISVTVRDQQLVYTGEAPVLSKTEWSAQQGAIVGQDDLKITLTAVKTGEKWNVGSYTIKGEANNANYTVTFTDGRLTITEKPIEVTIEDKTSVYGAGYEALTFTVADGTLGKGDAKEDLKVTLSLAGSDTRLGVGTYPITGRAEKSNYTVTFKGSFGNGADGTYTVTKKKIKIAIEDKTMVYDGREPALTAVLGTDWKAESGAIEEGDNLYVVLTKAAGVAVKEGGYAITGSFTNGNYEVEWTNGVYTVTARPVTVTIEDQSDTYHYEHKYAFDASKWKIAEETPLADGETREDLKITLTSSPTDAGTYPIVGSCANGNYTATFKGAYEKADDAASGKAGVYTVNKRDITADALFMMTVTGSEDITAEGDRTIRVKFAGEPLELLCGVTYREGEKNKSLASTLSSATIGATGEYTVTVTISDPNYIGTAEFAIIVTTADGYTEELQAKLDRLAALAEGKDKDALTADDFADLKEIAQILSGLTEEEREVASDRLTQYSSLVAAWNALADVGNIVETAEKIANSPIEALFAAAAALTALAGLAYIALKGGIL